MILVLTGAPGVGKGTQADLLAERKNYRKLSTGDALRKHVREESEIGKVAGELMAAGKLVPDDVLFKILKEELGSDTDEQILLDGYPRNVAQAETLEAELSSVHPVTTAVHLDVAREELMSRLCGRRVCKNCGKSYHVEFSPVPESGACSACGSDQIVQRPDDEPEKVAVRLDVYDKETAPILDFYKSKDLYQKVDGSGTTEEVFGRLVGAIEQA